MTESTARARDAHTTDADASRDRRSDRSPEGAPAIDAAGRTALRSVSLLALQRSAGNRAVGRLLAARRPAAPATGAPTVQRRIDVSQAVSIAGQLENAMSGWGTDEEAIFGALSGRTATDLGLIRDSFQSLYSRSLDEALRDELTDGEMARAQAIMTSAPQEGDTAFESREARRTRATDVVRQLHEAMAGWGTEEDQIYNALTGRTPYELVEISRKYHDDYGRELMSDLRDELSDSELRRAMGLVRVVHHEGDGPDPEIGVLQQGLNATGATPPVRITAVFGPETTAAIQAFQAANPPLGATGEANLETWLKLDSLAPRVMREGREIIEGPGPGDVRGVPSGGTIHPTISLNARGAAVEEAQQKLLTIDATQVPTRVTVNSRFDANTRRAVIEFQRSRTPPLPGTGRLDRATWAQLDAASGPVTVGREEFESDERVEGTVFGGPTRFTWRLHPDKLEITVNIRFTHNPNHAMVATWRQQIHDTWSTFKLVDDDQTGREVNLEFLAGQARPADASVRVRVTPTDATPGRSDAGNWHTGDLRPGLAPHEFGHLIGLQDEYNLGPEVYGRIVGEQPDVGETSAPSDDTGSPVAPDAIAAEIRTAVTNTRASRRGALTRAVVADKYGLVQGAFSQRVAIEYERANAGNLRREDWTASGYRSVNDANGTIANDIAARIPRLSDGSGDPDETTSVEPFLYTNRSLMGSMESLEQPMDPHDHPIAPRHLEHFVQIVSRNRPGNWRLVER